MKIGVADTMFARADMGKIAINTLKKTAEEKEYNIKIERYTVPGIKDLAIASKKLFDEKNCDLVIALGFVGEAEVDERCAMEAGIGLILTEIFAGKHILKVFVHSSEADSDSQLAKILVDRVKKHSINALSIPFDPNSLTERAGTAQRQGSENADPLPVEDFLGD